MLYRHRTAGVRHDSHNVGEANNFHARPRMVTVCGIVLGRLDDPDSAGVPECPVCWPGEDT